MLEWLATIGAVEIGKAVFEQGFGLGESAAENCAKDYRSSMGRCQDR
jgi:hypothetical protein